MNTQIIVTVLHFFWNLLFISYFGFGILGTSLSSFLTNGMGLALNLYFVANSQGEDYDKITTISFFDSRIYENMGIYLQIGLPNVAIIMLDWTCFEVTAVMSGFLGVK